MDVLQAIADEMDFEVKWESIGWEPVFQTIKMAKQILVVQGLQLRTSVRKHLILLSRITNLNY